MPGYSTLFYVNIFFLSDPTARDEKFKGARINERDCKPYANKRCRKISLLLQDFSTNPEFKKKIIF